MERNAQEEIKAHLMQTNESFRHLVQQHHDYERQVVQLEAKPDFSPADEIEEHRLKKLKLRIKDEMEALIGHYKAEHVS